jgi:hypothetical protein
MKFNTPTRKGVAQLRNETATAPMVVPSVSDIFHKPGLRELGKRYFEQMRFVF